MSPDLIAIVYAVLGEKDRALEWLQKAYDELLITQPRDALIQQMAGLSDFFQVALLISSAAADKEKPQPERSPNLATRAQRVRAVLAEIFAEWRSPFAACIAEGQTTGEIAATFAPEDLADFLLSSWEGAILRMKVERNAEPLERFKRIVFATVFKEPSP